MMKIFLCAYLNPINDTKCDFVRTGAMVVNGGKILEMGEMFFILKKYEKMQAKIINYSDKIIMPSFFDMHFHWVQDDVRLMPKDSLLEWLSRYTWPHEKKFASKTFASKKVNKFKEELLSSGTLGGACYASIHPHTVDLAIKKFIGNFTVGNVLMTMNSPEYLQQSDNDAIDIVKKYSPLYKKQYALTPRFAPTTSPVVMAQTSKIAKKNKSFIQTHLCETKNEIEYVLGMYQKIKGFEKIKSYTEIYYRCGILTPQTIMGHGIYLNKSELTLLRKTKTAIAHCPTSNAPVKEQGLGSGLFNFHLIEKNKINWALGSDIGGGPYLSMFDVMRSFVVQNRKKKVKGATFVKALFRATMAGAKILNLDKTNGNFNKNKWANFLVLDLPKFKKGESAEVIIKSILKPLDLDRNNSNRLVSKTFYQGELVYNRKSKTMGQ